MKQKPEIPIHHLQERAVKNYEITTLEGFKRLAHWNQAHRDDNYLFIFQYGGSTKMMVDFQEIVLSGCVVYCILPGQVHYGIFSHQASAWVLAADAAWIKEKYRTVFTEFAIKNKPVSLNSSRCKLLRESFTLLSHMDQQISKNPNDQTLNAMLEVCICLFVAACRGDLDATVSVVLRPQLITRQFRGLLLLSFREMKSPREYAAALHISASYLNEVVKDTTGYPVSYWIQQEIVLEAKRMLFYTDHTVKEIAYRLGYLETPYFIRLFTKTTGISPLRFRNNSRK
ncbi:helix-turn-helix domain-containing protein [Pedobacter nutrimenti]|jgi:AraC-like DNA-binding protein|uniref:AraC-like DNA-binding protein n=1 Tax=Pedobacter nutrimenti TaxID=1241337 RepID=A0A318UNQ4_9SPHI|nr:helix-turn-helix domain-containing protein [Pedobacter nutrimenti]PYF76728.1 AraC-like DNA-binding protein [Pedobacter nutrimenti]